jgi:hypothetical protein
VFRFMICKHIGDASAAAGSTFIGQDVAVIFVQFAGGIPQAQCLAHDLAARCISALIDSIADAGRLER